MALRPCTGCGRLVTGSRCASCKGTTAQRGYGAEHQRERARWQPLIDAGQGTCHAARCLMPARDIAPGTPWDLGHLPDRSGWSGPEHRKCNRATRKAAGLP